MRPYGGQPDRARATSRRAVRIIKPRRVSRAVLISFALALVAAVSFPLFWKISRQEAPAPPAVILTDREWKCDGGHVFHAPLRADARLCPLCGRPAYVTAWYTCSVHGSFEVTARLAEMEGGEMRPTHLRLTGRKWGTEEQLLCPNCKRPLAYKGRDPLARTRHNRRGGGG